MVKWVAKLVPEVNKAACDYQCKVVREISSAGGRKRSDRTNNSLSECLRIFEQLFGHLLKDSKVTTIIIEFGVGRS